MIKAIITGVKEVVLEIATGMKEAYQEMISPLKKGSAKLQVKLMGSYEELEALEKEKVAKTEK